LRRANNNVTVAVHSESQGKYSFPDWSDVKAGVHVAGGKTKFIDFTLRSKQVTCEDAVISEIVAGLLPGTEHQEVLFSQCGGYHPCFTVWLPAYRPPSKLIKIQVR